MFVTANPDKARTEEEKEDMARKYKPGDQILPKVTTRERTAEERRAQQEDQRLMDEVREMSLHWCATLTTADEKASGRAYVPHKI